ncbi:ABC transporter substrate-binding protein [Natronorubrum halophilum]|uniref:ABC transporter substrate-binding protein n=1 Tax=Natronorubrum halophilum TaxID=1702106 RepID=UPI000EF684EA|nr:ABC transporter substrate-binding protein [Natronorubrum halophilum]
MPTDLTSNTRAKLRATSSRRRVLQTMGVGAAAGLAGCFGDSSDEDIDVPDVELYGPGGDRIELTIFFEQGSDTHQDIASQIKSDLEYIGVELDLQGETQLIGDHFSSEPLPDEDPDDFEYSPGLFNAGPPDRTRTVSDWDLLYGIAANSYPRTPGNTDTFWLKNSGTNAYGYVPEVDMAGLYEDFRNAETQAEKQQFLNQIMGALTDELPANFISQSLRFWGFDENINTEDEFNLYGYVPDHINRYRDEQTVGGDYTWLTGNQFNEAYLPEQEDNNSSYRTGLISDVSYTIDTNDEVYPLFMDIEDSGDGAVWVCTLRDNLEFGTDADGNGYGQMTAEDWVYQIEYIHGVADDASDAWNEELPPGQPGDWTDVENVERTGPLEFQLELVEPDPLFPLRPVIWGEYCYPMELYEQYAPDAEALRQSTEVQEFTWTGNLGAYTFEERTAGQSGSFTAVRNDDYYLRDHTDDSNVRVMDDAWADAPYFDQFRFDTESEQPTRVERFRNGEADRMELPSENIQEFEEAVDEIRVEDQQDPYISFLFFNQRANGSILTRERDGREAIARVVDKETITQEIQRGRADPAVTFQPTWSDWYDESAVTVYGIDITEDDIVAARDVLRDNDNFTVEEV